MDELSFTEVGDILGLVEKLDCDSFELEYGELRISVHRGGTPGGHSAPAVHAPPAHSEQAGGAGNDTAATPGTAATPATPDTGAASVLAAPMTGTFYRSRAPGEPPCVEVGAQVQAGQMVALIEVMKLYTELKAEVAGTVVRIDVEDGGLVEYDQPLMWIEPR